MDPILVGYFPKQTTVPDSWDANPAVTEICSVAECIAAGPPDWLSSWQHNDLGLFDTPTIADELIPADSRATFHLFAYRVLPMRWVEGKPEPVALPPVDPTPIPASFERLGFDVVSSYAGSGFECSPLSCNALAGEYSVNQFCLFDELSDAEALAGRVEATGGEPGPYYIVEVWRQRPSNRDAA